MGVSPRGLAVALAARAEQEIRAYPKAYDLFYRALTRSSRVSGLAGRVKNLVRAGTTSASAAAPADAPLVHQRRVAAARQRLGSAP